jgi:hypothetical protein
MSIFFPFIILSIFSYFISSLCKIPITKSFLLVAIFITLFLLLFGKINLLEQANYIFSFSSILLAIYLVIKREINLNYLRNIFGLFLIYLILTIICKDLFLYKYDDFSHYGITSKLIFTENAIPFNIDYLQKGQHHKINLITYFQYFFLKNSSNFFLESTTLIAQSLLIILIINYILTFIEINFLKKIIISLSIYFLIYTLGPGFDRLYLDSILGLLIGSILLLNFKNKKNKSDQILFFLLILIIPMIKPNGLIIVFGLFPIIFFYSIYKKNYLQILLIIFALIANFSITKFYTTSFDTLLLSKDNYHDVDPNASFTIKTINETANTFAGFDSIKKNKDKFIEVQFSEITNKGIYHAKTFLILNKILSYINIDFQMINLPFNLLIWFIVILTLTFFISKKNKTFELYWLSFLYIIFIFLYYIMLIVWAEHNNLINMDFTLELSWERHLGSLILGLMIFLLAKFFKIYSKNLILLLVLAILINIAPANSIRIFLPLNIVLKDNYWNNKYNQRISIKNLSNKISNEFEDYSNLILLVDNSKDPYFIPILKYELIKINTHEINTSNSTFFLDNFNFKKNKIFIMTDAEFKKIEKFFNELNMLWKSNLVLKKKKSINNFDFYEILYLT